MTPRDDRTIAELIAEQKPGRALDQRFYTDPEIYELELDRIIMRNWILAGHESELPNPGDFKVFNVASESAIIVRNQDGELRAHANVCRHRGSLVCLERHGSARKFECPYHGWVYDNDGNLLAARNMPDGFRKEDHGLHRVSLEVLGGLLFICFCDEPPALDSARRDLVEPFALFGFDQLKVAAHRSYPIPANWKLAVENYQECYHCATAHPEYAAMHTLMLDDRKLGRLQKTMQDRMESCGLRDIEIDRIDTAAPPERWVTPTAGPRYSTVTRPAAAMAVPLRPCSAT
ncbi:MAG: aromatic ring-hydroxylating dioxygenase subunit alpha [Woeseiaceae bacterium]|nr:aromatic ring-hydroxylating dioxygenase subunit alpha [Woeseiaceae bacterium]